jgi:hypothetical protein
VTLTLTDTFYVAWPITALDEREAEARKPLREVATKQLAGCEGRISADADKKEGDLFTCQLDLLPPDGTSPGYVVLQWRDGKIRQLASLENATPPTKDDTNRAVFLVSASRVLGRFLEYDTQTVRLKVVSDNKTLNSEFEFKGYCKSMSIVPQKIADGRGSVELDIETDCSEISVDGAKYETRLQATDKDKRPKGRFVLELNGNKLVVDLRNTK